MGFIGRTIRISSSTVADRNLDEESGLQKQLFKMELMHSFIQKNNYRDPARCL